MNVASDDIDDELVPTRRIDPRLVGTAGLAALSSLALTWVVFERLAPFSGTLGFWLAWYVVFLAMSAALAFIDLGPVAARDRVATIVITSGGIGVVVPLVVVLGYVVIKGWTALTPQFFVEDQSRVGPLSGQDVGGAGHAIVGTLQQVGIAMLISVPLGLATAVYLNEVKGRIAHLTRTVVDAMSSVPSIVAGLFIYAAIIRTGIYTPEPNGQNGFMAGLALTVLMLPTTTRTAEVVLRLVPGGLREAGLALGATDWKTVRHVVLPTARSGLVTATILGIARVVGETAPLLLTVGGNPQFNWNPLNGKQEALPLLVYKLRLFPQETQINRMWTGAFVLLIVVLVLFTIARRIGSRPPGGHRRNSRTPRISRPSRPTGHQRKDALA
jgi:phosphate transport system permease protein